MSPKCMFMLDPVEQRLVPPIVSATPSASSEAASRTVQVGRPPHGTQTERRRGTVRPGLVAPAGNCSSGYRFAKRAIDVAGALVLLALLSPLLLTTVAVLLVTTRGKPIFRQERVGRLGRRFPLYKFRTMVTDAEHVRHLVKNEKEGPIFKNRSDPRITRIGRILRSLSIDELPQLVNVLRGDMSLVGPRPPLAAEVAEYQPWQRQRLAVTPGLTCLWQVSGRSEIGFDEWMLMDLWYVENQSLTVDLMLLAQTPRAVLSRRGAY